MILTSKQKKQLRALAHHLDPIVHIGKEGVTPSIVKAVQAALRAHELVKVRIHEAADTTRDEVAAILASSAKADRIGEIGHVVILFKRNNEDPKIELGARKEKTDPRRKPGKYKGAKKAAKKAAKSQRARERD